MSFSQLPCFPALEGHQFHFQAPETIPHVVPALLGQPCEVWPVSISAFRVPNLVQILGNLPGHPIARKINGQASAEESRLQSVCRIARKNEHGSLWRVRRIEF